MHRSSSIESTPTPCFPPLPSATMFRFNEKEMGVLIFWQHGKEEKKGGGVWGGGRARF